MMYLYIYIQNTLTHPARMCTCTVAELQVGLAREQVFDNIIVVTLDQIEQ